MKYEKYLRLKRIELRNIEMIRLHIYDCLENHFVEGEITNEEMEDMNDLTYDLWLEDETAVDIAWIIDGLVKLFNKYTIEDLKKLKTRELLMMVMQEIVLP